MKIQNQPRIIGITRIPKHSSMHPDIWESIREIAKSEKRSVSWVIAEIVGEYFGIDCLTGKTIRLKKRA